MRIIQKNIRKKVLLGDTMKKYKVGMIGLGFIGKVHTFAYNNLKYYYDLPFEVEMYGVCARSKKTLERAKKYGFTLYTHNPEELINCPEIDIIDISTPNIYHKDQILSTIKSQKPLYCEKPLVVNSKETLEIEKALKNYKKVNQMVFHNRFFPATIKTKSLIEEGFLGKPINFKFIYYHSGSLEKEKPIGWKHEKGAGVLLDLGSHIIDLAYWFLGEFESVTGKTKILYPERINKKGEKVKIEADDYVIALAQMKNGAAGIIEASKIAAGSQDELVFEIYGTQGVIKYNSMDTNFLKVFDCREEKKEEGFKVLPTVQRYEEGVNFPGPKFSIGWLRAHIHSIYNFLICVHKNIPASPSLSDGIYNMKVCEAMKKSDKSPLTPPLLITDN